MKQHEVTFIVDPVLSGDEIKATAQTYVDLLTKQGSEIVHMDEMGLRQLAYPINRRTSGVYYCIEFKSPNGGLIDNFELSLRRDERIMRFLTVRLDKYGVKYNEDKRNGLIGKKSNAKAEGESDKGGNAKKADTRKPDTRKAAPAKKEAPKAPVAAKEEEE